MTLAGGLLATVVAFAFVRMQWGSARMIIPGATVLGAVFVAIGLFQIITGRDRSRGLGLVGILFVAIVGFVGAVVGFGLTTPRRTAYIPPSNADDTANKISRELIKDLGTY